ncbi:MAG: glycosyltransferase family 2 protein [Chloroflexota bacterium]
MLNKNRCLRKRKGVQLYKMPKVSVIIPNYNHARFLERRFQSVLQQTYKDYEIVYLDDASRDDSETVVSRFLSDRRVTAILNKTNSGSPFRQWNKGIRASTGEYVWIAEADDFADQRLLAALVNRLDVNPTAGLAYCQSWEVNEQDIIIRSLRQHTADLDPQRWQVDFYSTGRDEISRFLAVKNTIPNASAVLFRRCVYEAVGGADETLTLAGDWMLWVKMLLISDVCFCAEPLNYFRTHRGTARRKAVRAGLASEEQYRVISYIFRHVELTDSVREAALNAAAWSWVKHTVTLQVGFDRQKKIYHVARNVDPQINWRLLKTTSRIFTQVLSKAAKAQKPHYQTDELHDISHVSRMSGL